MARIILTQPKGINVKINPSNEFNASKESGAGISAFIPISTHVHAEVVRTRAGDLAVTWVLSGLPFLGKEDWELDHRHATFNKMLQTLRAPDYTNIAYWVHDVRRRRGINFA